VDDPVPYIPFVDIVINLNLPEYFSLQTDGGYKQISGGVRGIIVYRINSSTYAAYERNCSFRPNEACATVNVHNSGLFMEDPCCGSSFNFNDGNPTGGPAWRPLVSYRTQLSGLMLTISSEVVN
jgi:nitrite reductase/ring-hydroxylating ferredoxin subunit